jgi:hypothetical protein
MAQYGWIYDTSDIKRQLKEANRDYTGRKTWESLYSGIDMSRQQALSSTKLDYASAISDAYAAAHTSAQAVSESNIGQGYKDIAMTEIDLALEEAYDSYRSNYLQAVGEIESSAASAKEQVNTALTEQAEYTKQFAEAPYSYLQWLYEKYGEGSDEDNIFYNDPMWKKYVYETTDEEGNVVDRRLKSWEELANVGAYDEYTDEFGNVQKDWTGMYDESGNLTVKGADFYDQMLNYFDSTKPTEGLGFGKWLAENNEELYNWSRSYNPYDYTSAGTNLGSFKTMFGLTSTDEQYSFIERFGGMSKSDLDNMYSNFEKKAEEISVRIDTSVDGGDVTTLKNDLVNLTDEIKLITDKLGITESLEEDMGISLEGIATEIAKNIDKANVTSDSYFNTTTVGTAGLATLAGLAVGGGVGALIGLIGSLIVTTIAEVNRVTNDNASKKQIASNIKREFDTLVTELVAYSHEKRRKTQGDFYKLNN